MAHQDLIQYIHGLEISNPTAIFETNGAAKGDILTTVSNEAQSFVSDKSIVSFAAQVGAANRTDVLNSTLLAQLAANRDFPNPAQITDWYKVYTAVLGKIGWVVEAGNFVSVEFKESVFEAKDAILEILSASFGAGVIPIVMKTLEAIKGLSDDNKTIVAFKKNIQKQEVGSFQIAYAAEQDGLVTMHCGVFRLDAKNVITQFLFFKSAKDFTKLTHNASKATLNPAVYAAGREAISNKLGEKIGQNIAEILI